METLKEAKTPAVRKKILVAVCNEFKEIFGDELDPPIITKGKNEKDLISVLTEIGKDALEIGDEISEQSEGIMIELGILSKEYLKAVKKRDATGGSEKGKKDKKGKKEKEAEPEPETKKGKKDKKGKKEKEAEPEPEPEPEKKLSKKEKKAAKKVAEEKAKEEKSKASVIKYSRYDAVADVIAKVGDFKNLEDLVEQSSDRYVKKTGKPANYNEAKYAAKNIIMVMAHFPEVKFSVGE